MRTDAVADRLEHGPASRPPSRRRLKGGGTAPSAAAVSVGNNVFKSGHNGSANPAVDTIAAAGTVTWTWANAGGVQHSIRSLGSPIFRNSVVKSGDGTAMTGTIVVR